MITQSELKYQLNYNEKTGIFTRLKSFTRSVKIGDIAGTKTKQGYIRICVLNKEYLAHRLAFLYVKGYLPTMQIDHINNKKDDNSWENLREATHSQNVLNRKIQKNNTTGYKGVYFNQGRWLASCRINNKYIHIGRFSTKEEASKAYQKYVKVAHGEFYCKT